MSAEIPDKGFDGAVNAALDAATTAQSEWLTSEACKKLQDSEGSSLHAALAFKYQIDAIEHLFKARAVAPSSDAGAFLEAKITEFLDSAEVMRSAAIALDLAKPEDAKAMHEAAVALDMDMVSPVSGRVHAGHAGTAARAGSGTVTPSGGAGAPLIREYPEDTRWVVMKELTDTERTYVNGLRTFMQAFGEPLRPELAPDQGVLASLQGVLASLFPIGSASTTSEAQTHTWMSEEQYEIVFDNIPLILRLHELILQRLEQSIQDWSPSTRAGPILSHFAPFLKMYTPLCVRYEQARETLEQLANNNEAFANFIEQQTASELCRGQSIFSYLIQPIQRVPRYKLLLAELLKTTPPSHPDYASTKEALDQVSSVAMFLNDKLKILEAQSKVYDTAYAFAPPLLRLIQPHRRVVRIQAIDMVTSTGERKNVKLFLFNDLYVVATPLPVIGRHLLMYVIVPVDALKHEVAEEALRAVGGGGFPFIVYGKPQSLVFVTQTVDEREVWLQAFEASNREAATQSRPLSSSATTLGRSSHGSFRGSADLSLHPAEALMDGVLDWLDMNVATPQSSVHSASSPLTSPQNNTYSPSRASRPISGLDQAAPLLVPDSASDACMICAKTFSLLLRRHHCRHCGKLVCDACSSSRIKLKHTLTAERVCDACVTTLHQFAPAPRPTSVSFAARTYSHFVPNDRAPVEAQTDPSDSELPQPAQSSSAIAASAADTDAQRISFAPGPPAMHASLQREVSAGDPAMLLEPVPETASLPDTWTQSGAAADVAEAADPSAMYPGGVHQTSAATEDRPIELGVV